MAVCKGDHGLNKEALEKTSEHVRTPARTLLTQRGAGGSRELEGCVSGDLSGEKHILSGRSLSLEQTWSLRGGLPRRQGKNVGHAGGWGGREEV